MAKTYTIKPVQGYMGAPGWEGSNAQSYNTLDELFKLLREDFKKAGVRATLRKKDSGYLSAFTVTVKFDEDDVRTLQGYKKVYNPKYIREVPLKNQFYVSSGGKQYRNPIEITNLMYNNDFTDQERKKILSEGAELQYGWNMEDLNNNDYQMNVYSFFRSNEESPYPILTEKGNEKVKKLVKIVMSYNYNTGNSYVDYSDSGFYADLKGSYKPKKKVR